MKLARTLAIIASLGVFTLQAQAWDASKFKKPSQAELKKKLTADEYHITQEEGTDVPFKGRYVHNDEKGIYVDIVSGEPLFSSNEKFDSGTGWPSFWAPLSKDVLKTKTDRTFGVARTEVRSRYADSHLGHVFDDGPQPTGLRYCMDGSALRFVPVSELSKEGYGEYLKLFEKKPDVSSPSAKSEKSPKSK